MLSIQKKLEYIIHFIFILNNCVRKPSISGTHINLNHLYNVNIN